ncbi:hypothetical protein AKJ09_08098 [Labilithrix luteola]|uniref:Lipoprotein n=1 Tax=Labilithrix luteola TaxID=1391654 RepID=A0A0K1Q7P8_9BACT|nr:hypothetical protein [Labilithrix luteola]AKV01435.1 hypothetical protein AKJ09_08098 [Labilithrix luteola]
MNRRLGLLALFALTGVACKPDLDQRASVLGGPLRVLAVRSEPAEAAPRDEVTFKALMVDANGIVIDGRSSSWGFCTARKPLAELGPVSPACYESGSTNFVGLGAGESVKGVIPNTACRDFGPEVPVSKPGEADGRPVDPDPTGGYYQPVTLVAVGGGDSVVSVDTTRLACGVSGAASEDVIVFNQRYHLNENPEIASLSIDGVAVAEGTPVTVSPGKRVTFSVGWPVCPTTDVCGDQICGADESRLNCAEDCAKAVPVGCKGAERYMNYDAEGRSLVVRREAMRVSWFSAGGAFDQDRSGRETNDTVDSLDNGWVAPSQPSTVNGWIVLRDERGGVAWRGFTIDVR